MGKGGSTTSQTIPYWLEDAARRNLEQADKISGSDLCPCLMALRSLLLRLCKILVFKMQTWQALLA